MRFFTHSIIFVLLVLSSARGIAHHSTAIDCTGLSDIKMNAGRVKGAYSYPSSSQPIIVSTSAGLIDALVGAKNFQTIVVMPGQYDIGHVKISKPINLISAQHWQAVLKKNSVLDVRGDNSLVKGFRFEDGGAISLKNSRDHSIFVRADNVQIIDNQFVNVGRYSSIADHTGITIEVLKSRNTIIRQNEFSKSHSVAIKTDDYSRNVTVSHNNFLDSPKYAGVGEIVHLGNALTSPQGVSPFNDEVGAKVINNYIRNWQLESELVSIKSDKNIIAYNFVENAASGAFVVRMGNHNQIHDNVMVGNTNLPIRISGENNAFFDNIFSGTGSTLFLHNTTYYSRPQKNINFAYLAANNNRITNNIFVGYENVFGTADQFHIVRDAPIGNEFVQNSIYTADTKRFKSLMQTSKFMRFKDNNVHKLNPRLCDGLLNAPEQ